MCNKCEKDKTITENKAECVAGHSLCEYADNISKLCIKCKDPLNYYADSV